MATHKLNSIIIVINKLFLFLFLHSWVKRNKKIERILRIKQLLAKALLNTHQIQSIFKNQIVFLWLRFSLSLIFMFIFMYSPVSRAAAVFTQSQQQPPALTTFSTTLTSSSESASNNPKLLVVELNNTYNLSTSPQATITLENKKILSIKDERTRLILLGKKEGTTRLRVGTHTYKIVVLNSNQFKNYWLLQSLLNQTPHLWLDFFDGQFQILGRLEQASTWLTLRKHFFSQYKMLAEISPEQIKIIESFINAELIQKKLFPITITPSPVPLVRLPPPAIKNPLISKILEHYGIAIQEDKTQIYAEPLIRVQVLLVEIRKSFAQNMGIEWPYEMSAKVVPQGLLPSGNEASMMAHFIATKGHGRVLANPVLLAKSGSEAEFFAGGEFPIKTKTKQTQTIVWKKYGITLKIKPRADADGKLSLDLNSEISSIDAGEKIDGIPSLFTNTLSSHFDLHQSQTIALSGLVKKIDGEAIKQWPGWGDIPILGSLFSSREYQEDKTELAVFVTPVIVSSQL